VTSVGLQVGAIAILSCTVQVVVPFDELHELFLDTGQLLDWELVLIWAHFLLAEEAKETKLVLQQEKKSTATTIGATARTAHSVDIIIRIIGRVVLDNPIDLREIKTTLGHVCAEQDTRISLAELEVG
jgi:hypothetical protein